MSRIGNKPVIIPENVSVQKDRSRINAKGPKGELFVSIPYGITVEIIDNQITVARKNDDKKMRALHGTTRAHLANIIHGVVEEWKKSLELVGVGYRAKLSGKELTLAVGFSHTVKVIAPDDIQFKVEKNTITVSGINKEHVGEIAAQIRAVRKPEPYKGKGIRYTGEKVRKKAGKSAKAAGGGV